MQFYIEKWLSSHGQACGFYATIYNENIDSSYQSRAYSVRFFARLGLYLFLACALAFFLIYRFSYKKRKGKKRRRESEAQGRKGMGRFRSALRKDRYEKMPLRRNRLGESLCGRKKRRPVGVPLPLLDCNLPVRELHGLESASDRRRGPADADASPVRLQRLRSGLLLKARKRNRGGLFVRKGQTPPRPQKKERESSRRRNSPGKT